MRSKIFALKSVGAWLAFISMGALSGCETSPNGSTDAGTLGDALPDTASTDAVTDTAIGPTPGCLGTMALRGTNDLIDGADRTTVTVIDPGVCLRTYSLRTTVALRDGQPENPRTVTERASWPTLRSGNTVLDALYALTLEEVRQDSVDGVSDGAFDNGRTIACPPGGCFETGRLWTYIWTRDTSYSVDLGLAALAPVRAVNSLSFKLSPRRDGSDTQIVQDTGTGGSWPVSTDRVVWALGARQALRWITGPARTAFRDRAYDALAHTLAMDDSVIFDPVRGVYTGEQSFLDWREQTYPAYTATDTTHIAASVSLSTNVLHLAALRTLASLSIERAEPSRAMQYASQADALAERLRAVFWNPALHNFSAFTPTFLDPAPVDRLDALATALAVLENVATNAQAREAIASYPHVGKGLAVIWPQQQLTAIYHNRAMWPFVTAYWLRAARKVRNDRSVTWNVNSLVRATALNLSNMENLEFATGRAHVDDGAYSGPVVNSQRQLWSVAAFASMVHDVLFGIEATDTGLSVRPYLPRELRATLLENTDSMVLNGLAWHGHSFDLVVHLPAITADRAGAYAVGAVMVDSQTVMPDDDLAGFLTGDHHTVTVTLTDVPEASAEIRTAPDLGAWREIFGPRTPELSVSVTQGQAHITAIVGTERPDVTLRLYRDGARLGTLAPTEGNVFTDTLPTNGRAVCYSVDAVFASGAASQHSLPACAWPSQPRITTITPEAFTLTQGVISTDHGRPHVSSWGDPGSRIETRFSAARTGLHLVRAVYANGAGGFTTGITCGTKRLDVIDSSGRTIASSVVVMPHTNGWDAWRESTFVRASLTAGEVYRLVLRDDPAAPNMSAFEHFTHYTAGLGGSSGTFNRVDIAALEVFAIE